MDIGRVSQGVDDLEGARFLPLDPVGVYGVHDRDRLCGRQLPHELQGPVEISPHLDDPGAVTRAWANLPRAM